MSTEIRHSLPHDALAPSAARRALDALDDALAPDALGQLRLVVSELVTNAVRHGDPTDAGAVELAVGVDAERARVEVIDGGHGFAPTGGPEDNAEPGGWGLVVVDQLADRWGIEVNGKTLVWLEFDRPSAGRHKDSSHS
jgi:anti-sigma regulatory factor (Ser/Thr protein kinase)